MYHPPRGGVRGGRDQFNWDEVKTDKHRENYLGHSLYAPVGRWQQGKDLTWYSKESKNDQARKEEIRSIKETESDLMAELLGGGKRRTNTRNVSQQELKTVLKKEQEDYDDDGGISKEEDSKMTKKGLGFKSFGHLSVGEIELGDTEIIGADSISKDRKKTVEIKTEESININLMKSAVHTNDEQKRSKKRKRDKEKKDKERKKEKKHKRHKKDIREPKNLR